VRAVFAVTLVVIAVGLGYFAALALLHR